MKPIVYKSQCGMQNADRNLTNSPNMLYYVRRLMASSVYNIGQALYPVFVDLAERAILSKDMKLFWLYSDLCDTIHVHLLEQKRKPKAMTTIS